MVVGNGNWSFNEWINSPETDRIELIDSLKDIPFQILVLASQDPSFAVRATLLSKFQFLTQMDNTWLSLLKRMSDSDPDADLRMVAFTLLEQLSGAS